jgi:hypothetical protein
MLPFPRPDISDEDAVLGYWEAAAEWYASMHATVDGAALTRHIIADLRAIRQTTLEATLSLTEAAGETGYSTKQVSRWVRDGKIANVGTPARPRVKRADILSHKKPQPLPSRPEMRIVGTAQDIARAVVNSKERR